MEINREREKSILKGVAYSVPSPSQSDAGTDDDISEVIYLNNQMNMSKFVCRIPYI